MKPEGADEGQKETVSGEVAPGVEGELSIKGVGDEGRVPSEQGKVPPNRVVKRKTAVPGDDRKRGAKPTGVTPSAGETKETGPAPPSHPVSDDQKAALDAAINPSTIDSSKPPTADVQSRVGEPQREVATAQDQQGTRRQELNLPRYPTPRQVQKRASGPRCPDNRP